MATKKMPRGKPFQKGQSGNPGGRPKIPKEFVECAREHSIEALHYLISLLSDTTAKDSDRLRAAEDILAYGYGKPSQSVDLTSNNEPLELTIKYV